MQENNGIYKTTLFHSAWWFCPGTLKPNDDHSLVSILAADICDCTSVQQGSLGNGACEDSGCKGSKMKGKSDYFSNTLFWLKSRGSIYSSRDSVTTVDQAKDDAGLNE